MAYSSLACKATISPNYVKRTMDIDSISIHCTCSDMSIDSMGEIYKDPERKASAHYGIDSSGNIAVFVDEKNASMSLSNKVADSRSISIMVSSIASVEPYQISTAANIALLDLLVDICIRNNIRELKWKNDEKIGKAAGAGGPVTEQNILIHTWYKQGVVDPGKWILDNLSQIVSEANAQLVVTRENQRRIVFLGDDRAAKMHEVIGTDYNIWLTHFKPVCSWVGSKNLTFESELNDKYAVCIIGSAYDVNYIKPKDYAEKINKFATTWISKGCAVYYTSITPVSRTGFRDLSNDKIKKFNDEMKSNLMTGVGFIDAYSSVEPTFIVTDGYFYDDNTNKEIYGTMIKFAARMSENIRLNLSLNLNPTNFNPYVVMFDRNATVNYKALSDLRVTGAIIEAGYRFDINGTRTKKFDNPNIETQIENLEKYKIPYGLYTICRAKSTSDAKTEIQYFQYQLYRHPPRWGAWLAIDNLPGTKLVKDSILKQYNESLSELGLNGRMGLICTRKTLESISWDKWQDVFYLYLIEHMTDLSALDNLLDPQLFDIDGTEPTILPTTVVSNLTTGSTTNSSTTTSTSSTTSSTSQIPASVKNASKTRQELVSYAFEFIGTKYVLGASGMKPGEPLDCGQFVCAVYYHFGMDLRPNRTNITKAYGKQVPLAGARPGDVVHWPYNPKYSNAHVGIYLGENKIIEATSTGSGGVQVSSLGDKWDRIVNIIDYWKG